jgi:Pyruvate/2-oxoacid:ferredoxin oxidoreductase delta subunit
MSTGNNLKQNIDETHSKQPKSKRKIHTSQWILTTSRKKFANQKACHFCQIFVISKEKTIP